MKFHLLHGIIWIICGVKMQKPYFILKFWKTWKTSKISIFHCSAAEIWMITYMFNPYTLQTFKFWVHVLSVLFFHCTFNNILMNYLMVILPVSDTRIEIFDFYLKVTSESGEEIHIGKNMYFCQTKVFSVYCMYLDKLQYRPDFWSFKQTSSSKWYSMIQN